MLIIAKQATIFLRAREVEPGATPIGIFPPEDQFRVNPSPEPQEVPDWVRDTSMWRYGIKDGRLREATDWDVAQLAPRVEPPG